MIGQTISHYTILEKPGAGGMGAVRRAEDVKLGGQGALKFLAVELVSDPEIHQRFEREAKAAASLRYPHICHAYEIDEAGARGGRPTTYLCEGGVCELPSRDSAVFARRLEAK